MQSGAVSAILLHSTPFQDQKLLLDFLVEGQGRVRAVGRRPAKNKGGRSNWSLFCRYWLELSGQSELKTVRKLEEQSSALQLGGDWLFCGLYLNELTCRLFPAQMAAETLYQIYTESLQALWQLQQLAAERPAMEVVLRQTELAYLQELGLIADITADSCGAPLAVDAYYQWYAEVGFVRAATGFAGADLLAIAAGDWQERSLRAAKQLCRLWLSPLLGKTPLHSRSLFARDHDS